MLKVFFESNFTVSIHNSLFYDQRDTIGWDWKEYKPDLAQKYTVNKRKLYIIKDKHSSKTYKLRFINFTDNPIFQYRIITDY